jgi:hypothetical protein
LELALPQTRVGWIRNVLNSQRHSRGPTASVAIPELQNGVHLLQFRLTNESVELFSLHIAPYFARIHFPIRQRTHAFRAEPLEEHSVAIECPHCKSSIAVKNVKPGRYAPKCPKCTQKFFLSIPDDPSAEWVVGASVEACLSKPGDESAGLESQSPSIASTKKIRAESSSFEDMQASDAVQPLTKKMAAADTERIPAVPDSIDEETTETDSAH